MNSQANDTNKFISIEGNAENWEQAIRMCGKALYDSGYVYETFADACVEREKNFPTGLEYSTPVAIPHAETRHVKKMGVCFLRLDNPVEFNSMENPDKKVKTKLVFNLAVYRPEDQVKLLASLMRTLTADSFIEKCETLPIEKVNSLLEECFDDIN